MSAHEPPATLAAFFTDGRLTSVPRKPARRAALLQHLARSLFEPERAYSEREVNEALLAVHADTSMLRRYLVEAHLLTRTRDGSSYRLAATVPDAPEDAPSDVPDSASDGGSDGGQPSAA
ncbi:DUF2087 domain-containing protein [Kitasatospora sp. NA04385]|uniref:DUF2087 domain-containing protein n=1 Tax=Kitasatospora sp. NA04385 TaxID=2742135 RepID=UPI00159012D7|nr:DUF2087 domain-containing protein [Kitasatospora sp. NA04385]QKW23680.1 DUF2087 domain-containing protein [Kitasatospora sp. NA04385]